MEDTPGEKVIGTEDVQAHHGLMGTGTEPEEAGPGNRDIGGDFDSSINKRLQLSCSLFLKSHLLHFVNRTEQIKLFCFYFFASEAFSNSITFPENFSVMRFKQCTFRK